MDFASYIDNLYKHGNHFDFEQDIREASYSYHPLLDACIVRSFHTSVEPQQLVNTWTAWFEKEFALRDFRSAKNPVLEHVARCPELMPAYHLFQHEIRAHRLPLVYSSLGTMIAYWHQRTNDYFLNCLVERRDAGQVSDRSLQSFTALKSRLGNLLDSLRYVIESLAVFRDMIIFYEANSRSSGQTMADAAMDLLHVLEKASSRDDRFKPYLIGYKMALTIYQKLDFWGVEAAVGYALNPMLDEDIIKRGDISPFLRYNQISQLSNKSIPKNLDTHDPLAIDSFIRRTFHWDGYEDARDIAIDKIKILHPQIIETGIPSTDYFKYASNDNVEVTIIPEISFFIHGEDRTILMRQSPTTYHNRFHNFIITLLRDSWEYLFDRTVNGKWQCPFQSFYGSPEKCIYCTEGKACEVIQSFCDIYGFPFTSCVPV